MKVYCWKGCYSQVLNLRGRSKPVRDFKQRTHNPLTFRERQGRAKVVAKLHPLALHPSEARRRDKMVVKPLSKLRVVAAADTDPKISRRGHDDAPRPLERWDKSQSSIS
jgi:hypothetical protein